MPCPSPSNFGQGKMLAFRPMLATSVLHLKNALSFVKEYMKVLARPLDDASVYQ